MTCAIARAARLRRAQQADRRQGIAALAGRDVQRGAGAARGCADYGRRRPGKRYLRGVCPPSGECPSAHSRRAGPSDRDRDGKERIAVRLLRQPAGTRPLHGRPSRPHLAASHELRNLPFAMRLSWCASLRTALPDMPNERSLTLVDIRETTMPEQGEPIHWRLVTTHKVDNPTMARMVLDFYRRRWIIEDYFRTLKTAGFDIEAAEIEDPDAMARLVGAVSVTGVIVLQLVRARDGTTDQMLEEAFDPADQPLLEALSAKLEGKTRARKTPIQKARSPTPPGSSPASGAGTATMESRVPRSCVSAAGFPTHQIWSSARTPKMCESNSALRGRVGGGAARGLPTCAPKPLAKAYAGFPHPDPPPRSAGEGAQHRKRFTFSIGSGLQNR